MENIAPAPGVQAPTPVEEKIAPAPAILLAPAPVVKSFSPAPAVSRSQAPVLSASPAPGGYFSPAPAVLRVGGLKGSVPGQSFLESGWRRAEDASGRVYYWHVHTRQTRWTPPVTGFEDENEEDEEDEEDEDEDEGDEDVDEIYAESRFPAGFLPMRMCRWFPSRNCRQGWWCMFAHSVNELHPLLVIKGPDIFVRSLVSGSHLFGVGLVRGCTGS